MAITLLTGAAVIALSDAGVFFVSAVILLGASLAVGYRWRLVETLDVRRASDRLPIELHGIYLLYCSTLVPLALAISIAEEPLRARSASLGFGAGIAALGLLSFLGLRFADLQKIEREVTSIDAQLELERNGRTIWIEFFALLPAGITAVFALVAVSAKPLGIDRRDATAPPHAWAFVAVMTVAMLLAMAAYFVSPRHGPRMRWNYASFEGHPLSTVLLLAAVGVMALGSFSLLGPAAPHQSEALVIASALGIFASEDIVANSSWLQLATPNWGAQLTFLVMPVAVLGPVYWILQTGLWSSGVPADTRWTAPLVLVGLSAVVVTMASAAGTFGLRSPRMIRMLHPPGRQSGADQFSCAVLIFLVAVLPAFIAAHADTHSFGKLAVQITAISGVCIWGVGLLINLLKHPGREGERAEKWESTTGSRPGTDDAEASLDIERRHRIAFRIRRWQGPLPLVFGFAAFLWLSMQIY